MSTLRKSTLAVAFASLLSACGGGGGSADDGGPPVSQPTTASGKVIDGYVRGATVFCDGNDNGKLDAGEDSVVTGAGGAFTLGKACASPLVAFGGTDETTGFPFEGRFAMQPGGRIMSIMTTLLAAGVPQDKLLAMLGLPAGTDLAQVDMGDGRHFQLLKTTAVLHQLITDLIKLVKAGNPGKTLDIADLYARMVADLAATLSAASAGARIIGDQGALDGALLELFVLSQADIQALGLTTEALTDALNTLLQNLKDLLDATEDEFEDRLKELQDPEKLPDLNATTDFVTLGNRGLAVNGQLASLADFAKGLSANRLQSIGFDLNTVGDPDDDVTVRIAMDFKEVDGDGRRLTLLLDGVRLRFDRGGLEKLSFGSDARLYVFGLTPRGVEINLTLDDLDLSTIKAEGRAVTLDYEAMVRKVVESAGNTSGYTEASAFLSLKGRFQATVAVSPLNLRQPDGKALERQRITVPYTTQSVTGAGFAGLLTIR